jgi:hypothetical protein
MAERTVCHATALSLYVVVLEFQKLEGGLRFRELRTGNRELRTENSLRYQPLPFQHGEVFRHQFGVPEAAGGFLAHRVGSHLVG